MNDELKNNQNGPKEPAKVNCKECQKNPCICPDKKDIGEKPDNKNPRPKRNKPPKISWI